MLETSARLLRLLSLLQSRRDWTGAELAERAGVGLRTLRRDIGRLRDLGYPVDATPGAAGGYRLGVGAALPPLLLDDEEAVAVAISLHTATTGSVAGLEETALRALTKLQQMLPSRIRHRVSAFHATTVALAGPGAVDRVDPDVLTALAAACRDQRRVRIRYPGRGGVATREVEPYQLVHTPRRWYLLAWDLGREDWRTFRVDRIGYSPGPPGARFTSRPLPADDVAAYVSQAIASAPYRYQARILFRAPLADVARQSSPTAGRLEAAGPDACVMHTGSNSLDELALYVGLKGFEFEVLDPPELAGVLRSLAGRLRRGAGPDQDGAPGGLGARLAGQKALMVVLRAFARPMLASIYIVQGYDTFRHPEKVAARAEPVVQPLRDRFRGVPAKTEDAVRLNGAVQMVAGTLLALGRLPRLSALALAASLVPTTAAGHRFWEEDDPATKAQQRIHFLKNVSMLGGLLIAVGDTAGQPSIAWRARYATQTARKETSRTTRRAQHEAARTARLAQQQATRTVQSAQHEAARTIQTARREAVRTVRTARVSAKVGAASANARRAVGAAPRRAAELARAR